MSHIFLSYSRRDIWVMRCIRQILEKNLFPIWSDEKLEPGTTSWKTTIEKAIDESICILAFFSENSKQSEWVRRELDYAQAQRKPIIPLLISGDEASSVPFGFNSYQWIDLRSTVDFVTVTDKLINKLRDQFKITPILWNKTANVFWAGHDIMFLVWISSSASKEDLLGALRQAQHHLRELGFNDFSDHILQHYYEIKNIAESQITQEMRNSITNTALNIRNKLFTIVNASQPDLKSRSTLT